MDYFLTLRAIFLCGEDKYHKCCGDKFIIGSGVGGGGGGGVKHRAADTERYI